MGQYGNQPDFGTFASSVTPNDTISFANNVNASCLYIGTTGDVSVILTGVVGLQGTVTKLNLDPIFTGANPYYTGFTAGSGYVQGTDIATTANTIIPSNLTVDITVPVPTTNALTPGTGYSVGAFTVTGGNGTNLSGTIDSVTAGAIATFTILVGGTSYQAGDVLTIVEGTGTGGAITLATAPNGAITGVAINKVGEKYSVGDIITIAAGGFNSTFCIGSVKGLLPDSSQALVFKNIASGTFLPVIVDYVLAAGTTATDIIAIK